MSDPDATLPPRRKDDSRVEKLQERMEKFEGLLAANTTTTTEVRDILITFRTLGKFAVWIGSILAAVIGGYLAVRELWP